MKPLLAVLAAIAVIAILAQGTSRTRIESVRTQGTLVVAVLEGPSSYFEDGFGPGGFEYALAEGFARELGVRIVAKPVASEQAALELVAAGDADIAIGQALDDQRLGERFALSVPVRSTEQLVICRRAAPEGATTLADVVSGQGGLLVAAGSHQAAAVAVQAGTDASLHWQAISGTTEENLLAMVHQDKSGCAVVDADSWEFHQHLYPSLVVAAEFERPTLFGWIQSRKGDSSLRQAANAYLARRQADGTLKALSERHFAHVESLTTYDSQHFLDATRERLPRYVRNFRREADRNGLDWRLVAAVAYQESHWNPDATSPTGVRGLMQLTNATADYFGIADRTDATSSIVGGAKFLRFLIDSMPADIPEPDRTWMALAAYNAGPAHVIDARELTRQRGGNPDSWPEVRANLALLKDPRWYTKTRYGYARGATQAVVYVRHVRRYYDLLVLASNSSAANGIRLAMNDGARATAE